MTPAHAASGPPPQPPAAPPQLGQPGQHGQSGQPMGWVPGPAPYRYNPYQQPKSTKKMLWWVGGGSAVLALAVLVLVVALALSGAFRPRIDSATDLSHRLVDFGSSEGVATCPDYRQSTGKDISTLTEVPGDAVGFACLDSAGQTVGLTAVYSESVADLKDYMVAHGAEQDANEGTWRLAGEHWVVWSRLGTAEEGQQALGGQIWS